MKAKYIHQIKLPDGFWDKDKKETTYQKLKKENKRLSQIIADLILRENEPATMEYKMMYIIEYKQRLGIWEGYTSNIKMGDEYAKQWDNLKPTK